MRLRVSDEKKISESRAVGGCVRALTGSPGNGKASTTEKLRDAPEMIFSISLLLASGLTLSTSSWLMRVRTCARKR